MASSQEEDQKDLFKKNQELLKKNQQQLGDLLKSLESAMVKFKTAASKLGLDLKYPHNPTLKNIPINFFEELVQGFKKMPQLDPSIYTQAAAILDNQKKTEAISHSHHLAVEKLKDLNQIQQEKEVKSVRFAKILKAANIHSSQYPTK